MIDEPPLLRMARDLAPGSAAALEALRGMPTSFLADAMGGHGALDWRIKPVGQARPFAGTALTCSCGPADNLALCAAVARCSAGHVLVAATSGHTGTAVTGDLLLGIAANRGAVAFVTDGLVRDQNDIEVLGLPCYAAGTCPNSPSRSGPGEVGLPIICGGVGVATGDLVVGDRDGVIVIPAAALTGVLERIGSVRAAEQRLAAEVSNGLAEVAFIAPLLASGRVEFVDG
jgi:4-hydroxy-4-methyl-2-oxoglutarate aldolase